MDVAPTCDRNNNNGDVALNKNENNVIGMASEVNSSTSTLSLEEEDSEETVTLTLQVPKSLYELLKEWIQKFADEHNWDIEW